MCEYLQSQYVLDAFFSVFSGKLFDPDSGIREGIGCEVGELESLILDDGASRHMTSSHDSMINYHECSGTDRTAGGDVLPIEGIGDILLCLLPESGAFDIQLLNVAFVPQLSHNLLSLQQFTAAHHTHFGTKNGVELHFKSGRTLQAKRFGRTNVLRGTVWPENMTNVFRAIIAPRGNPPTLTWMVTSTTFTVRSVMFMGDFCARQRNRNINLTGTLRDCQGCSIAKGRAKPNSTITGTRVAKPGGSFLFMFVGRRVCRQSGGEVHAHDSR